MIVHSIEGHIHKYTQRTCQLHIVTGVYRGLWLSTLRKKLTSGSEG
jgi:hypothetical protein